MHTYRSAASDPQLRACLLDDDELRLGEAAWAAFDDPFLGDAQPPPASSPARSSADESGGAGDTCAAPLLEHKVPLTFAMVRPADAPACADGEDLPAKPLRVKVPAAALFASVLSYVADELGLDGESEFFARFSVVGARGQPVDPRLDVGAVFLEHGNALSLVQRSSGLDADGGKRDC